MNKFWLVWNPANRIPVVEHPSFNSAYNEAARLARFNPDEQFIVLQSCGTMSVKPTTWERHDDPPKPKTLEAA